MHIDTKHIPIILLSPVLCFLRVLHTLALKKGLSPFLLYICTSYGFQLLIFDTYIPLTMHAYLTQITLLNYAG